MRCPLGLANASTCLPPAGTGPGGIVVVVDQLTIEEDKAGRQGLNRNNQLVAALVNRLAKRPFILDAAVKCHAGAKLEDLHVEQCRPYLWHTISGAQPDRIIVTGPKAAKAVLGRSPMMQSTRRGYGWLLDAAWAPPVTLEDGRTFRPVPVFFSIPTWVAQTNAFVRDWFEKDLQWACTTPVPKLPPWDGVTWVIETPEDAQEADQELRAVEWVSADVETSGRMHSGEMRIVSLAFATPDGRSWVWDEEALANPEAFNVAAALLEDRSVRKIGQSFKYDMQAIEQGMGVTVRGLWGDTRIWRRQIDSDSMSDLGTMAELVGMGGDSWEVDEIVDALSAVEKKVAQKCKADIIKRRPDIGDALKGTKDQIEVLLAKFSKELTAEELRALWRGYVPKQYVYGDVPADILSRYNAADTVITAAVANHHLADMETRPNVRFTWDNLWGPATEALVQVETWGFPVSRQKIDQLSRYLGAKLDVLRTRFLPYGVTFNPSSDDQVRELLYTQLKLKPVKTSEKTGAASTDKGSLDALKGQHPVIDDLIEWRHISKLKSQYADGMILHIAPDGRIHTTYNVDGARSGRLSSENPNMQNIPSEERDPHDSKLVKDCFIARPGYTLLASDYKQLEFRVAADLSDDQDMKAVFEAGDDFHTATALFIAPIVWKVKPCPQCKEKWCHVTKSHRRGAKTFNFGIMYGMQDGGIAERAGCSMAEAKQIRQAVLGKFRKFAAWIQQCLAHTRKHGNAWTYWLGQPAHCRQLYLVKDSNDGKRINAENSAYNTPVQGTASFYCLASVTTLVNWLLKTRIDAKLVATVHDSIVLEVRDDLVLDVARKMHQVMTSWPTKTGVPLDIDIKAGQFWGSMTEYLLPEAQAAFALGGHEAAQAVMADQIQSSDPTGMVTT